MKILIPTFIFFASYFVKGQSADFAANTITGCSPLTVNFSNLSSEISASATFFWELGNGNTSIEKEPSAIYTNPGNYTIRLTVKDGAKTYTKEKEAYITVFSKPTPDFTFSPTSGCSPLQVNFTDKSTSQNGTIVKWEWVFGNGATSSEQNPVYQYDLPGNYEVTLRITDEMGCTNTETTQHTVNVAGPSVAFTVDKENLCSFPATVQFTNTSIISAGTTYYWEFGDGSTSSGKDPTYTYNALGEFSAKLTATNSQGCSSTYSKVIKVGTDGGVRLSASKDLACVGEEISFTPTYDSPVLERTLNFDDGTQTTKNFLVYKHKFLTEGTYEVELTAKLFGKECISSSGKLLITIAKTPTIDFDYTVDCEKNVSFLNKSEHAIDYVWDFGDSTSVSSSTNPVHPYQESESYTVVLTGYNIANCSASFSEVISVDELPEAKFLPFNTLGCGQKLSGCAPFNLQLTDMSDGGSHPIEQFNWKFGDGFSDESNNPNPNHTYVSSGTYDLQLIVTNSNGCKDTVSSQVMVSDVKPVANFTFNKTVVCAFEPITFSAASSVNADSFCWDFGDANVNDAGKPLTVDSTRYLYSYPGKYSVTLRAFNNGCESEPYTIVDAIEVVAPGVNFEVTPDCSNPGRVFFTNSATSYDSFEWDFGDGTTSTTEVNPIKTYSPEGGFVSGEVISYVATLKASNSQTGCKDVTISKTINLQKSVVDFEIEEDHLCLDEPLKVTNKSIGAQEYTWSLGDGIIQKQEIPDRLYTAPGNYLISLAILDKIGCVKTKWVNLSVLDVKVDFEKSDPVNNCDSLVVSFKDKSQSPHTIAEYNWDFGDGTSGSGKEVAHNYFDVGEFSIGLTVITVQGDFCSLTKEDFINFQRPIPRLSTEKEHYCIGDTVKVYDTSENADPENHEWVLPDGQTSNALIASWVFLEEKKYPIQLTAIDTTGCAIQKRDTFSITKPDANFIAYETVAECPPLITIFENTSKDAQTFYWDFGDGQTSAIQNPANTYLRPGDFDVQLIVKDANECADTLSLEKIVRVGGPDGTISVASPLLCKGSEIPFVATTTNTVLHRWDFGDGNVKEIEANNTTHVYNQITTATVSAVFIDENGCEVAAPESLEIEILGTPKANFTFTPPYPFDGESVYFIGTTDAPFTTWIVEDTIAENTLNAEYLFDSPGVKTVKFISTNEAGCSTDTTMLINIFGNLDLYNIFTPNGDEFNQTFKFKNLEHGDWHLTVYNRWGKIVYENARYSNNWNASGVSQGVYFYTLRSIQRPDKNYRGSVTIVK